MADRIKRVEVYGRQFETANDIFTETIEDYNISYGISVGTIAKANEDCLGVSILDRDKVLAIADGHWGNEASEIAIKITSKMLSSSIRSPKDNEALARLYTLFEQINSSLLELAIAKPGAPTPETSLVVCYFRETPNGNFLYWGSFGDSFLFLLRNGVVRQLNSLNSFWLGALSKLSENSETKSILLSYLTGTSEYVGVPTGFESGIEKLESEDIFLLCTDGLIGSDDSPDKLIIEDIRSVLLSNLEPNRKVYELINSALVRGEKNNISCIYFKIA